MSIAGTEATADSAEDGPKIDMHELLDDMEELAIEDK
jgi:hypothetical protein